MDRSIRAGTDGDGRNRLPAVLTVASASATDRASRPSAGGCAAGDGSARAGACWSPTLGGSATRSGSGSPCWARGRSAVLGGLTAARLDGLTGFDDRPTHLLHPGLPPGQDDICPGWWCTARGCLARTTCTRPGGRRGPGCPGRCWTPRRGRGRTTRARALLAAGVQQRLVRPDQLDGGARDGSRRCGGTHSSRPRWPTSRAGRRRCLNSTSPGSPGATACPTPDRQVMRLDRRRAAPLAGRLLGAGAAGGGGGRAVAYGSRRVVGRHAAGQRADHQRPAGAALPGVRGPGSAGRGRGPDPDGARTAAVLLSRDIG